MDRIDADALVIPRLQPPYASTLHRDAEAVEHESLRWLRSVGIGVSRREAALLEHGRFAWLAARAYPRASRSMLRLVTEGPASAGFFADLAAFVRAVEEQLDLVGARPSFDEELRTRERTIGLHPCLHLIAPAVGLRLAEEVRRDPDFVARDRLAAQLLCWTNDLVSIRKELRDGEPHNLILAPSSTSPRSTSASAAPTPRWSATATACAPGSPRSPRGPTRATATPPPAPTAFASSPPPDRDAGPPYGGVVGNGANQLDSACDSSGTCATTTNRSGTTT
jgi:hypothetical protein